MGYQTSEENTRGMSKRMWNNANETIFEEFCIEDPRIQEDYMIYMCTTAFQNFQI